jgi:hypothetical protein
MRSHGVPNFPDPRSGGGVPKADAQQLRVSSSQLQTAQQACQDLLPNVLPNGTPEPAQVRQALRFSRCMRTHGYPTFPDPSPNPPSSPGPVWIVFDEYYVLGGTEIDNHSPAFLHTVSGCDGLNP